MGLVAPASMTSTATPPRTRDKLVAVPLTPEEQEVQQLRAELAVLREEERRLDLEKKKLIRKSAEKKKDSPRASPRAEENELSSVFQQFQQRKWSQETPHQ